ncbi:DUF1904 family protein [Paenibacillus sp. YYML68]|uniref:DUF1904 family protein n=1 Tax=Paenibacillus sp. YYML68 TaxID=2909250 RepID=UPI0024913476|nr:DUF1904 family protein [Paenibacillus sp. YYML68]
MPALIVRGISPEAMRTISTPLVEELASICSCGTDNFTIECLTTTGVFGGELVPSFPFIEVTWFERGQDVRDRFAAAIHQQLQSIGIEEAELAFIVYAESSYYINDKRFGS